MQHLKPSHAMFWGGILIATLAFILKHKVPRRVAGALPGQSKDIVDIASEESFPASDSPAY